MTIQPVSVTYYASNQEKLEFSNKNLKQEHDNSEENFVKEKPQILTNQVSFDQ